jgi:hypothetical protein
MSKRTIGIVILIVGLLIILGSLGAGYLGLSASTAIGTKKLLGAAVGVIVDIIGIYLIVSKQ